MATAYLVSTALMGVLVLGVVAWMVRGRGWYQYSPQASPSGWSPTTRADRLTALADRPMAWVAAFAVLVVGLLVGVVASISGPIETQAVAGVAVAAMQGKYARE